MLNTSLRQRGPSLATSAFGAALATTITLLLPQPASALNFTFNFGDGISGIIEGLNDNQTNQTSAIVKILSISPNDSYATGGGVREYYYWSALNVNNLGFDVQNGSITATNWTWAGRSVPQNAYNSGYPNEAYGGNYGPNNGYGYDLELKNLSGIICYSNEACFQQGPIQYSSSAAAADVPAPLPVFGAFAAFGYSRKLRQRMALFGIPKLLG
jgi:hypothetical protein